MMKMIYKVLTNLFLLCAIATYERGANVQLSWAASDGPVSGYYVYCGMASGDYSTRINAGPSTQLVLSDLQACQTYYFVVRAYDNSGNESPPSNEIAFLTPGVALQCVNGQFVLNYVLMPGYSYKIEASTDLQNWTVINSTSLLWSMVSGRLYDSANYPARFYRVVQN